MTSSNVTSIRWSPDTGEAGPVVSAAGGSDVGRVREVNEDSWLVGPPVFLVADGMGGHSAGDVASQRVASVFSTLTGQTCTADDVAKRVEQCFAEVDALAAGSRGAPGTTLVSLVLVDEGSTEWLLVNIGDSRAYRLLDGELVQISHDHSLVQEMVDAGEIDEAEARVHPDRHVITRAIGAMEGVVADVTSVELPPGSRVLLCSDGVNGEVDDDGIALILRESPSPASAVEMLLAAANMAGGHDNSTAVVIDVEHVDQQPDEDTLGRPVSELLVDSDTVQIRRRRA